MKTTSPCILLCAAALPCLFASCSSTLPAVTRVEVASLGEDHSLAGKVFDEVNLYRARKGKSALERHSGLDSLAQKHCDYLAATGGKYSLHGRAISHVGFEGRALAARHIYHISSLSENVVASTDHSSKNLVSLWAGSKNHEFNMRDDWALTGIGTAMGADGMVISTQIFGTGIDTSHLTLTNKFNRSW